MSQNLRETTSGAISRQVISSENTAGNSSLTADLERYLKQLTAVQDAAHIVRLFSRCSDSTGGFVTMRPEHYYIPELGSSIPLYHFIEVLDEVLDYASVIEELPNLSYAQVGGAISFLRKMAQCNPCNIDIDKIEDEQLSEDPLFLEELRKALADEETSRVLTSD
jgi:chitinase